MSVINIITFHGSHNFGSMLQAFSLKYYISQNKYQNNLDCNVINYRTYRQRMMYSKPFRGGTIKSFLKSILFVGFRKPLDIKYEKFELFLKSFITDETAISDYNSLVEKYCTSNDYFLAGSDQIWNASIRDFDIAYFLAFTDSKHKYSYAASCGQKDITSALINNNRICQEIAKFKRISVREPNSKEQLKKITSLEITTNIDPTLLLTKEEWYSIFNIYEESNPSKYIYFYSLDYTKDMIDLVNSISIALNMPVLVSNFVNWKNQFTPFKKCISDGPIDFLSRIANATLIISSSYHGTVFSILFNKPFYSINGDNDSRISHLLKECQLIDRSLDPENYLTQISSFEDLDYTYANEYINNQRKISNDYFIKMITDN